MSTKTALTRGWAWPLPARFQHYFTDGHSLCTRWQLERETVSTDQVQGPIACSLCISKLKELRK